MTQSGLLDRRIELGNIKWVTDDEGFQQQVFVPFARPWAQIKNSEEPVEINDGKETVTVERVTFKIYYREGITKAMLVRYNKKEYQINGIFNPNFRNEYLILTASTENSRGNIVSTGDQNG